MSCHPYGLIRALADDTDPRLTVFDSLPTAALFQRAQGLGERPLQPGEVVGLAMMVRRELVGPNWDMSLPDRSPA